FADAKPGTLHALLLAVDRWWKAKMTWVYEQTFGRFGRFYARVLRWSLRHRMDVLVISLLAMASLAIPANPQTGVKPAREQNMGGRQVSITYTMPQDVTLEEADVF